jgi:hypothetical protein
MYDRTGNRSSNIVGLYVIRQAAETIILLWISDKTGNRNSNIVGVCMIEQAAETME